MQSVLEQHEREATEITDSCYECGSINLINDYDTGETICGGCGLVLREQMINKGPEWRAFRPEEKKKRSRVGPHTSFSHYDKNLFTDVGRVNRDAYGRRLSLAERQRAWILRKWDRRSKYHDQKGKNLANATSELDRLSDKLFMPGHVKEETAVIYRKARDKGLIRGRTIAEVVAAASYLAFRTTGNPRTLREIAEASSANKKAIARSVRVIIRKLDYKPPTYSIKKYIDKVAEMAGISGKNVGSAIRLYEEARSRGYPQGKSPMGDAAGALYLACQQNGGKKTQEKIAEAAGVTVMTVRNRYKSIKLSLELPN